MATTVERVAPSQVQRRRLSLQQRETIEAFIGLTPYLAGFVIFTLLPILYSFYLSFTDYDVLSPPKWIGLANYVQMFTADKLVPQSLWVTLKYTIVAVPAGVAVGYALGILLNQKAKGLSFWRTGFYIPAVVPALATAYLFMWLLQSDYGIVNTALRSVHLPAPKWWGDPDTVVWSFVLMALWGAGGGVVLYLSSLQGVPTEPLRHVQGGWRQRLAAFPQHHLTDDVSRDLLYLPDRHDRLVPGLHPSLRQHAGRAGQWQSLLHALPL